MPDLLFQVELGHPLVANRLEEPSLMRLTTGFPSSRHLSLTIFYLGLGVRCGVHIGSLYRPRKIRPQPGKERNRPRQRPYLAQTPMSSSIDSPPGLVRFLLFFRQNSLGPHLRPRRIKQRLLLPVSILVIHD
jgi:hypothetical protein